MIKDVGLKRNTHTIVRPNNLIYRKVDFPTPPILDIMHFMYCANDFDGTKIPNKATNSDMGDYLQYGTLTKNGSGSDCYLSNDYGANYLYITLTQDQLNLIKADNGTYTIFCRVISVVNNTGGILSCRSNGGVVYMIRCSFKQLQIHADGGHSLGSDFSLETDNVYKIVINGYDYYAKNLTTGVETSFQDTRVKNMGTTMTTFWAGYSTENYLTRFYGMAGVARATTSDEDEAIKNYLLSQGA